MMRRVVLALAVCLPLGGGAVAQGGMGPGPGMVHSVGVATCASVLPNLLINLDASDSATVIRSGANVSAWNDKSGNGNDFTAVNNPQYSATSWPGSLPSITFLSASSRYLTRVMALSTTTLSVFVVGRVTGNIPFAGWFSLLGNAATNDFNFAQSLAVTNNTSNNPFLATRVSATYNISYAGLTNTIYTVGVVFDGANGTSYQNFNTVAGTPTASTGTFGNGASNMAIGARQTTGPAYATFLTGDLAEVIVTTGAVTGTDLTNLHSCLTTKWGVP